MKGTVYEKELIEEKDYYRMGLIEKRDSFTNKLDREKGLFQTWSLIEKRDCF